VTSSKRGSAPFGSGGQNPNASALAADGGAPARHSQMTAANAYTSARPSIDSPSSCSGGAYVGVAPRAGEPRSVSGPAITTAVPKSMSAARSPSSPSALTTMFSGFTSAWTIPCA